MSSGLFGSILNSINRAEEKKFREMSRNRNLSSESREKLRNASDELRETRKEREREKRESYYSHDD